MANIIEKEIRGPLTPEITEKIKNYAQVNGWDTHSYKQISIYCNTDHIQRIGSVEHGNGRIILDIRDNRIKIKIKIGNALNFTRQEYTISCDYESAEAIAVFFSLIGIDEGFVRTFDRTDYLTNSGVQLTVKLNCLMGDHFELERNSDSENVIENFNTIFDDLGLILWTKNELSEAIQNDHNKVEAKKILEVLKELK